VPGGSWNIPDPNPGLLRTILRMNDAVRHRNDPPPPLPVTPEGNLMNLQWTKPLINM
jgi:hypothetical protein